VRRAAATSNAAIAKDVAGKRTQIAEGKKQAQDLVRHIQTELASAKVQLKALSSSAKSRKASAAMSLDLLQQLKEAKDAGLLTDEEFEAKRQKLVADI
jgi:hypothetical protein